MQPTAATTAKPQQAATSANADAKPAAGATKPQPTAATASSAGADPVMFITRPAGATVTIHGVSIVAPGTLDLSTMREHVSVTAKKDGFQSTTTWIDQSKIPREGAAQRRVYLVLPALPAGAAAKP